MQVEVLQQSSHVKETTPNQTIHAETLCQSHSQDQRLGLLGLKILQRRQLQCADGSPVWLPPHSTHTVRPGFLTGSAPGFPTAESQMSGSIYSQRSNTETARAVVWDEDPQPGSLHPSSSPLLSKRSAVPWSVCQCPPWWPDVTHLGGLCYPKGWQSFLSRAQSAFQSAYQSASCKLRYLDERCSLLREPRTTAMAPREMIDPGLAALLANMDAPSRAPLPPWIPSNHRGLRKASSLDLSLGIPLHTLACAAINL